MDCPQCRGTKTYRMIRRVSFDTIRTNLGCLSTTMHHEVIDVACHVCTAAPDPQCNNCGGKGWTELWDTYNPRSNEIRCMCLDIEHVEERRPRLPDHGYWRNKINFGTFRESKKKSHPEWDKLVELGWLR